MFQLEVMGISGMNKKNRLVLSVLLVGYVLIIVVFGVSMSLLSTSYVTLEKTYLEDVQREMKLIFDGRMTLDGLEEELAQVVAEYPMEVIVSNSEGVVFETIDLTPAETRQGLNSEATLLNTQGQYMINGESYFIWYNVYHLSAPAYIDALMQWQFFLIGIAVLVLITISFVLQRMLFKPLESIDKAIDQMGNYEFDELNETVSGDQVNKKLRMFALNLNDNIQHIERNYTELEQALQIERERLANTISVSRAFIHDLKSPLHQTMLENEMVEHQIKNIEPATKKVLEYNVKKAEEVILQINGILQVMDQNIYALEKEKEEVDIVVLVKNARNLFRPIIQKKEIYFSLETPEHFVVETNIPTFKLLMHNILSNAFNYAEVDSEITFEIIEGNHAWSLICTNETDIQNIERMKQSASLFNKAQTSENKLSSGNGLFLIKELAETLGGSYRLEVKEREVTVNISFSE